MDLWELLMITVRRWKVTLPVAIISFGVAFAASGSVPPEYKAEAAVAISGAEYTLDAGTGQAERDQNPLVVANEGRSALAFAEKTMVSSDAKVASVEAGNASSYTVTLDRFNPILDVSVVADSPEKAVATAAYVVDRIESEILDLQALAGETEEDFQLQPRVLYVDEVASEDATPQTRMLVILLVIATLATIGTAVLADAFFVLRERRKANAAQASNAEAQDWDEAQEMIESATRLKEVSPVGATGDDIEEWGRR
jgi:cbb3-type cytochrome oxidase subunit 3